MMTPPHILMTADTVGGVWTYAVELARGITASGARVSLATMGARPTAEQRCAVRFGGLDLYESSYKLEWMDSPWRDVDAAGDWLLGLCRQLKPDLVHLNNYAHGNLDWGAPVVVVGHSCVFSWWQAVHGSSPPAEWSEYRRRVREGLQGAATVVAVSRAMLHELERWYGISQARCVIYNGHGSGWLPPSNKEPFVFSTGRVWDAAKNIATLDAAAPLLRWPVYVAGEAQHPEGGLRLLQHVTATGTLSREEIASWFGRAGIYALPAVYEPFGLSILEAALSECALVLGDIPSLREIWEGSAVFVPAFNHRALAAAINDLIEHDKLRENLGRRARDRALRYSADRMTQGYLDVYRDVRAGHGRANGVLTSCAS